MATKLWAIGLMIGCAVITAVGQLFYKLGALALPAIFTNWQLLIGFVCYGLALVLFVLAMRGGEVNVLYPILATAYIWTNVLAMTVLREAIPLLKWAGSVGILVGISLIGFGANWRQNGN